MPKGKRREGGREGGREVVLFTRSPSRHRAGSTSPTAGSRESKEEGESRTEDEGWEDEEEKEEEEEEEEEEEAARLKESQTIPSSLPPIPASCPSHSSSICSRS